MTAAANTNAEIIKERFRAKQIDPVKANLENLRDHIAGLAVLDRSPTPGELATAERYTHAVRESVEPAVIIRPAFEFLSPEAMLELQGEPDWVVRELGICPGRPCAVVGVGGGGKTIWTALLAACVCSGSRFLGQFMCPQADVCWIDFEMGKRATLRRLQRLCRGHGLNMAEIAKRLRIAIYPRTFLNSPDCEAELVKAVEGVRLCVVDSLRRSLPGIDENDSRVADYLQMLSRVSEVTGCAFIFIHHASTKGDTSTKRDKRSSARGSSAIYDGSGSYILISGPEGEPPMVSHVREPQEGRIFEAFHIEIVDVPGDTNPKDGLRVEYRTLEQVHPPEEPSRRADDDVRLVVEALAKEPSPLHSIDAIVSIAGLRMQRGRAAVQLAISRGEILRSGPARVPSFTVPSRDVEAVR